MSLILDYQDSFREGNANLSQEPDTQPQQAVNWADAPFRYGVRPCGFELPLPNGERLLHLLSQHPANGELSLLGLAKLFWLSNGLLSRKLEVNWNMSASAMLTSVPAYARGTTSGGGLYPVEHYLVAIDLDGLPDGIYLYSTARSSLLRIRAGRFAQAVAASWHGAPHAGSSYLIQTIRFWKNVFKYQSFGYQLMTEDAGAMIGALLHAGTDMALASKVRFHFADEVLADLLGLEDGREVVSAVLEMGRSGLDSTTPTPGRAHAPRHVPPPWLERSKQVKIPPLVQAVHAATICATNRPLRPAQPLNQTATAHPLPRPPCRIGADIALFVNRKSSMGRQSITPRLTLTELGTLLASAQAPYDSDLAALPGPADSVRIALLAQHVEALPAGRYTYCNASHSLNLLGEGPGAGMQDGLQAIYRLQNYNLQQAGLIIALIARQQCAHDAWGERSIRILNAEAGLIAQRLYLACAHLDLACGAILGIDCKQADAMFALTAPAESTILFLLVSRKPAQCAAFDARFEG